MTNDNFEENGGKFEISGREINLERKEKKMRARRSSAKTRANGAPDGSRLTGELQSPGVYISLCSLYVS